MGGFFTSPSHSLWPRLRRPYGVAYETPEVVNKCLENYLRCFTQDRPKQWLLWLPWAEFWYNTTWHSSIKMTPYEAVYG
jgi:hypothetical protein